MRAPPPRHLATNLINNLMSSVWEDYVSSLAVRCTTTSQTTGKTEVVPGTPLAAPPFPVGHCDPLFFQPGYYDREASTWHDHCSGRQTSLADPVTRTDDAPALLAPGRCPLVAERRVVWVHFVGDSVTRGFFLHGMLQAGVSLESERTRAWGTQLAAYRLGMKGDAEHQTWFSFQFSFINRNYSARKNHRDNYKRRAARTWGDFVQQRGQEPDEHDPGFARERTPDVVFYGPGYHASTRSATWYGKALAAELRWWGRVAAPPSTAFHVLLNVMPAPWLIPDKYARDRKHRTELNEYRKNLAILAAARQSDLVRSVVDVMSVELPFNAEGGMFGIEGHKDAVHIGDWRLNRIIGEMLVDRLCNSGTRPTAAIGGSIVS